MSLDLLKNALYQALKASIPTLNIYPETIDDLSESFPSLAFVELETQNLQAKPYWETVVLPNPDQTPGAAPNVVIPVISRMRSTFRLQLRDSLGQGPKDVTAYQRIRDQRNAVERFLVNTRTVMLGTAPGQTLAELWYVSAREAYDPKASIFLHEFTVRFDPWRLLDAGTGVPTFSANAITLEVQRESDNAILITRLYPLT